MNDYKKIGTRWQRGGLDYRLMGIGKWMPSSEPSRMVAIDSNLTIDVDDWGVWEPYIKIEDRYREEGVNLEWVVVGFIGEGDELEVRLVSEGIETIEFYKDVEKAIELGYLAEVVKVEKRAAVCEVCKKVSPYATWEEGFKCWGCKNGW